MTNKRWMVAAAVVVVAVFFLTRGVNTPEGVVEEMFDSLRAADVEAFRECHTAEAWKIAAPIYAGMADPAMAVKLRSRMADVSVRVEESRIDGDSAFVDVRIQDGEDVTHETVHLTREGRSWRVDHGPGSARSVAK